MANKPKIRFKGFDDAWEQRKVSELFRVTVGMFLQRHKQKRRKQTKSLIRSILHRPKIKG